MTSFAMRYREDEGAIMEFTVVDSPAIKFACVMGNEDITDYLVRMLLVKTLEEQYKISVCGLEDWQ